MKKHRKLIVISVLTVLILLIACAVVPSLAWLKTSKETPFRLGADPKPGISIYTANYTGGQYKWSGPLKMQNMRPAQSFGTPLQESDFQTKVNAAMGVIDQLDAGSLDESNYTWFCIRVHEDEGLKFKDLKLEFAQEPFQFFGSVWDASGKPGQIHHMPATQGNPVGLALQDVFKDDRVIPKMMEIAVPAAGFVTNTPPTDGAMPAVTAPCGYVGRLGAAQTFPVQTPQNDVQMPGGDGYYTVAQVDQDGYYYIYFRIGPNLAAYYYIVDYLFMNMPCYLSFDGMTVSIDVRK